MSALLKIYSAINGIEVGRDQNDNRYYIERLRFNSQSTAKRWVVYYDKIEASAIPAEWHLWLHYTSDNIPEPQKIINPRWLKDHAPNHSGTAKAYHPDLTRENNQGTKEYEAWQPK